jgi:toluene monooxygenase system protein E
VVTRHPPPPPLRTYSHLADRHRVPSEYEIVSSRLLYYVERGFAIDVPVAPWYQRHQTAGRLRAQDWERFADPRETTYSSYTSLQAEREQHLDALMRSIESTGHDRRLSPDWRELLDRLLPPLRYLWHGFQMMAAYVGQMAPASRLTLVAMFQAADEMRRIHRLAHRLGQLRDSHPGFAGSSLVHWQEAGCWQPARRALETALVAYDWDESFTALCLCLKPLLDQLLIGELAALARPHDFYLAEILSSLEEDCRWQRAWSAALVQTLIAAGEPQAAGNREALAAWLHRWTPPAREAARALARTFWGAGEAEPALSRAQASVGDWLSGLTLEGP